MPFDDQLRDSLDRFVAGLRAHLESDLRAVADELSRVAAADRQRVTDEATVAATTAARAEVQKQVAELRDVSQRENDAFRRAAEGRIEELARAGEQVQAELDAARRDLDAVRTERDAARAQAAESARQADAMRNTAHAEAEEVLTAQLAVAAADHQLKLDAAVEQAHRERREAETAAATQLLAAVRGLDATRSLGEVLDVLTHCGARDAERAAVLIVKGDSLQGWRFAGFGSALPRPSAIVLSLNEAGIAGAAVRVGATATHGTPDEAAPALPRFAQQAGGRYAVALPVLVGDRAVAVLYADSPYADSTQPGRWAAVLEVLTRHASRVLETRTLQQAVGLAPEPVARGSQMADSAGPPRVGQP